VAHLDRIVAQLESKQETGDEILRADSERGDLVRYARVRRGSPEIGGDQLPLLMIDYWLLSPDHANVAHLAFSTPHLEVREAITVLADNVALNGTWAFATPEAGPNSPGKDRHGRLVTGGGRC
jgi:hypothetical protein